MRKILRDRNSTLLFTRLLCGYGGIGRRAGFRFLYFMCVGSSPTNRISDYFEKNKKFLKISLKFFQNIPKYVLAAEKNPLRADGTEELSLGGKSMRSGISKRRLPRDAVHSCESGVKPLSKGQIPIHRHKRICDE